MTKIVDLKIKLDLLRTELHEEFEHGSTIERVRELHADIEAAEKLFLVWKTLPEPKN